MPFGGGDAGVTEYLLDVVLVGAVFSQLDGKVSAQVRDLELGSWLKRSLP